MTETKKLNVFLQERVDTLRLQINDPEKYKPISKVSVISISIIMGHPRPILPFIGE